MKKMGVLVWVGVLALLIAGSAVAYRVLSEGNLPDQLGAVGDNRGEMPQDLPDTAVEEEPGEAEKEERTAAPDVVFYDGEGNAVALSDLFGVPIVLNFWASWCPPCKQEMPEFDQVHQELGETVRFVMVDLVDGSRETRQTGEAYVREMGFVFPVYFDEDQDAAMTYGVRSIPTTLFLDEEGYVVAAAQGMIDRDTLLLGISMAEGNEMSPAE